MSTPGFVSALKIKSVFFSVRGGMPMKKKNQSEKVNGEVSRMWLLRERKKRKGKKGRGKGREGKGREPKNRGRNREKAIRGREEGIDTLRCKDEAGTEWDPKARERKSTMCPTQF